MWMMVYVGWVGFSSAKDTITTATATNTIAANANNECVHINCAAVVLFDGDGDGGFVAHSKMRTTNRPLDRERKNTSNEANLQRRK